MSYNAQYPYPQPPGPPPPEKKGFRFQMWMLGALIVPVGIGIAVRDVLKRNSLELGEECSNSDHCKSHTCLEGDPSVCTTSCSPLGDACPAGFACVPVKVTLQNQSGFHDLGAQTYCMRAPKGVATVAASASAPPPASPPPTAAPPPPAPTASTPATAPTPTPTAAAVPPKPSKRKPGKKR